MGLRHARRAAQERGLTTSLTLKVDVYALEVRGQRQDWPEKTSRGHGWLPRKDAALLVDEPELVSLLMKFEP
jgi:hypothetical protein